ncbi:lysoplasmalogenase [Oceanicoccus sp. KOV_DT_Chl]|uniref:lysoplasmalogenase n=1 Tax=Oceanicoccus sp. KOV_DT_Chl TaxID=1904639 RepID=UPI000C7A247D|nr:lysoplasmalogenase [Oceanicoccus sp. KOV_DT_Chl]
MAGDIVARSSTFWLLAVVYMLFFAAAPAPWAAVFKVLPLLSLIAWAIVAAPGRPYLILALVLGASGDALLALGYFIPGLIAFLLGHLVYILLWRSAPVLIIPLSKKYVAAAIILAMVLAAVLILPSAGGLFWAIASYLLVITLMALIAMTSRLINHWGVIGVCSFLLSDFILAWNEFVDPISLSMPLVMISYYLAQYSICRSVIDCHTRQ